MMIMMIIIEEHCYQHDCFTFLIKLAVRWFPYVQKVKIKEKEKEKKKQ